MDHIAFVTVAHIQKVTDSADFANAFVFTDSYTEQPFDSGFRVYQYRIHINPFLKTPRP